MQTFGDWLKYYNNLDVAPFLEALQKMKEFYTSLGVDIFKDAVSLPGVSQQYILLKTLQGRKGYKPPELYAPNKEAYDMLKAAVVGGPSLVFTRKHVVGETKIRSHQYEHAHLARHILGYDANSLYPSTMMKEMPCGPGVVTTYNNPEEAARVFPQLLYTGEWFGFAEVDIEVPRELWPEFEEFPPLFVNRSVPDNLVPKHMHDYLKHSGRKRFPEQPKLLGVLSAKNILEEIGDAYKIELRKSKLTIDRPFQVGIVVYQLAKLRMLQFCYEFRDFYLDRRDFELIQMDTDSMYFALSHKKFEDAIKPGYETQFEEDKKLWLAWDKWSNRKPGLFKLEKQATSGFALCSECYHMEDKATGQAKVSSKGVNKRQNEMRRARLALALEGSRDMATNRAFRMHNGAMYTYEQRKLGLSAYYDKRWVLPDGIYTEPIEYHQ